MYQQFNRYKILEMFFNTPHKHYQLRELSRCTHISLPSIKNHVEALLNQDLIKKKRGGVYTSYIASYSPLYRLLKRNDLLLRLETSGFLRAVTEQCTPNCVVLYGSAVQGGDDERGDVDIFIQSMPQPIPLEKYEPQICRKISLLFEPDIRKLSTTLKNSLTNGIVLYGYLKVLS
ncbi:MAG: hypothetical protein KKC68_01185 [Candidatus Thermoplasmatota archaeon]|nr:hypothetical protein [Candidatus Thermoplasmatota archaeon]MBU1940364.1 hypothetical protein [Candidatus Thermoplasmatota archaeon]